LPTSFYQPNFDPEKKAITRDDIAHLTRNSPEQTRWICVLMLEGYTHSEIADRLGITVRRIEYLLHKLRKRALKMSAAGVIDPPKWVQARPPASKGAA
jgi:DNA-directed RNA polymerase specialized sigma24 family protein